MLFRTSDQAGRNGASLPVLLPISLGRFWPTGPYDGHWAAACMRPFSHCGATRRRTTRGGRYKPDCRSERLTHTESGTTMPWGRRPSPFLGSERRRLTRNVCHCARHPRCHSSVHVTGWLRSRVRRVCQCPVRTRCLEPRSVHCTGSRGCRNPARRSCASAVASEVGRRLSALARASGAVRRESPLSARETCGPRLTLFFVQVAITTDDLLLLSSEDTRTSGVTTSGKARPATGC